MRGSRFFPLRLYPMGSSDNGWELSEWADWPTQLTAASAFAVYMQEIPESVQATVDTMLNSEQNRKKFRRRAKDVFEICYQMLPTDRSVNL
jgi:hypothetical protein